jgi:hypothetical protein
LRVNATNVVERVRVGDGGRQIASQVGTHLVGGVAEFLKLPLALSEAMEATVQRRSKHDRGRLLTQVALTLAAGGRCVTDVAVLRNQPSLFGEVASDATVWRTFDAVDEATLARLRDGRAAATGRLLERLDDPGPVVIDVDASLFEIHSERKEGASPHFVGGFGFHPMFAFCEPAGVPLAGRLREGRAGANDAEDHLTVIDDAIAALPATWQAGHRVGDDPALVCRRLLVRADTAGYSHSVIGGLAARNCEFSIGMPANDRFDGEIHRLRYSDWRPALTADGQVRRGAHVAEIDVVPDWMPAGTRVIVRRERPHPGAPLKLWDHNGWRHQVIVTNQTGDPVELEARHRQHAQVENRIKQLKDIGDARFPFTRLTANAGWLETMLTAALLLGATRRLLLDGELAEAEPRRLRHTLLGCPARLIRRARQRWLRLPDSWPWTHQLLGAYRRLDLLAATPG